MTNVTLQSNEPAMKDDDFVKLPAGWSYDKIVWNSMAIINQPGLVMTLDVTIKTDKYDRRQIAIAYHAPNDGDDIDAFHALTAYANTTILKLIGGK